MVVQRMTFLPAAGLGDVLNNSSCCRLLAEFLTDCVCDIETNHLVRANCNRLADLTALTALAMDGDEQTEPVEGLRHLRWLRNFTTFHGAVGSFNTAGFTRLQDLCLQGGFGDTCDLRSCKELTSLSISPCDELQQVLLPDGDHVCLKEVRLEGADIDDESSNFAVTNLSLATQLTGLTIQELYPRNLAVDGWPTAMPNLQYIRADHMPCAPPFQFSAYKRLTVLKWEYCKVEHFPAYVSQLTQLRELHLRASHFGAIPLPIMQLAQLECLDLAACSLTQVNEDILQFAEWQNLRYIDLSLAGRLRTETRSLDSRLLLGRLRRLLRHQRPDCEVKFGRIHTN